MLRGVRRGVLKTYMVCVWRDRSSDVLEHNGSRRQRNIISTSNLETRTIVSGAKRRVRRTFVSHISGGEAISGTLMPQAIKQNS